jgi:hypothetical protein
MDFNAPERGRYYNPRPTTTTHRESAAADHESPQPPAKKRRIRKPAAPGRKWLKIIIPVILIAGVVWFVATYIHTRNQLISLKNGQGNTAQSSSQQVIDKVGKLVVLPQGETPTIATVNDASKLKNQQFFANAQDGDKVLIFSKSGKAVLYRPATNQIVEYSKVNLGS